MHHSFMYDMRALEACSTHTLKNKYATASAIMASCSPLYRCLAASILYQINHLACMRARGRGQAPAVRRWRYIPRIKYHR